MRVIESASFRDIETEEALKEYNAEAKKSSVYYIEGELSEKDEKEIAELFTGSDQTPITTPAASSVSAPLQRLREAEPGKEGRGKDNGCWIIETRYKDEVSDPAEDSIKKALRDMGKEVKSVRTAKRYYLKADADEQTIKKICRKELANETVEDYFYGYGKLKAPNPRLLEGKAAAKISEIEMVNADDETLQQISREGLLALSLDEMKAIQAYFRKQNRNPTDGELETLAQTWSEHCKHKTFNSKIEFDNNGSIELIGNLFKETIVAATSKINKEWVVSAFKDNAGIMSFDDKNNFAFKVETHNHPSALDPYGGASTGVGGVIRDILGAGLGAKPIFSTDVFGLAEADYDKEIPEGMLHPKRMFRGVVAGVRDYGNRMGIPTVNGAFVYHDNFLGAPLVFCGTGGIIPKGMEHKKAGAGELIVAVGGKTGRDGLHGATFSSKALDEASPASAVQIGNPIEEKKVLDALLAARDKKLYTCITDCGAGGFSSAIGEMAQRTGAEVELSSVLLKHGGIKPWEIWMSESQERMIISVPEQNLAELKGVCSSEDVTATVIGRFTDTKKLVVKFEGRMLIELDMDFLQNGLPKLRRKAKWKEKELVEPEIAEKGNYNEELKKILSHPTIASKEEVIRRYDHEVQGNTIGKPLSGVNDDGPSDAAAIRPEFGNKAIVVANGINPRYSAISSYWMAASAIDEALRNIVASGGSIQHTALLDNFCWGNVNEQEKLGSLVMAAKACHDFALLFGTPFISGKDSLHNEFKLGNQTVSIPDTLLISAASVINSNESVTMDLKEAGNSIYIIGETYDELGGSYFYDLFGETGSNVPKVRAEARQNMLKLTEAMRLGLVKSCHDCSEGGIAAAAAEMSFAANIGMEITLAALDKNYKALFSESNSRFLVEVKKEHEEEFEKITNGKRIGETVNEKKLIINIGSSDLINCPLDELKEAWQGTIKW
ncbi:phosphoribosylformylglycinamidine synthase subunit PurL [Candidatus Woesearchaeota archaeon]|nr:phosphoribosylformylglycinamidine synthase subunit PurL [Candidatus Woesearchaeota archaeon]